MIEPFNSISSAWWDYFLPFIVLNTVFVAIILLILDRLKLRDIKFLNIIALVCLFKLLLPVVNVRPPMENNTLAGLTGYFYPEFIFKYSEAVSRGENLSMVSIAFIVWIGGVLLLSVMIIANQVKIFGIIKRAERTEVNGISYDIEVFRSTEVFSPFSTGLLKKRIILPQDWNAIPLGCKKAILAHEAAHINNLDNWLNLVRRLVLVVNFFNPVIILFLRKVSDLREIFCDQQAIRNSSLTARQYSEYLVEFAESISNSKRKMALSPAFTESYRNLKIRLRYNLSYGLNNSCNKLSINNILIVIFIVALTIPLSLNCTDDLLINSELPDTIGEEEVLKKMADGTATIYNGSERIIVPFNMPEQPDEIPTFIPIENQPKLIGGNVALMKELSYPEIALRAGIEGVVVVQYVVSKEGIPTDLKVVKSLHDQCDEAALNALRPMRFIPAVQNGKPVAYRMSRPIRFVIK